jgi:hypothetical protein
LQIDCPTGIFSDLDPPGIIQICVVGVAPQLYTALPHLMEYDVTFAVASTPSRRKVDRAKKIAEHFIFYFSINLVVKMYRREIYEI